jgi:hypothetical protein
VGVYLWFSFTKCFRPIKKHLSSTLVPGYTTYIRWKGGGKVDIEAVKTKVIADLKQAIATRDEEVAHHIADSALCELLEALGYGDVVKLFDEVDKWYA